MSTLNGPKDCDSGSQIRCYYRGCKKYCHKGLKAYDRTGNIKADLYGICKGIQFPPDNKKTKYEKLYTGNSILFTKS